MADVYIVTPDWQGGVCTAIWGKGLHTVDISGTYNGNYICSVLDLYINGKRVESSPFCHAGYPHTFKTGLNHNWPGKTSVKVCARNIPFKGMFCGPTLYIHA